MLGFPKGFATLIFRPNLNLGFAPTLAKPRSELGFASIISNTHMIGFPANLKLEETLSDEGADTKNLSKNALYDLVSSDYLLPMYCSKGVTREWLIKVYRGDVYRIGVLDHKKFDFTLTPDMQRRVPLLNNAYMVRKLNKFLELTRNKPLGFSEFEIPEQDWLFKVARYADPTNILEFFEIAARPEGPLTSDASELVRMHHGRVFASEYLLRKREIRSNRKLWDSLKGVSEVYRSNLAALVNIDVLEHEYNLAKEKQKATQAALHDQLSKTTITYCTLDDPDLRGDMFMQGGESMSESQKSEAQGIYNL